MTGKLKQNLPISGAPSWLSIIVLLFLIFAGLSLRTAFMNNHNMIPVAGNYLSLFTGMLAIFPLGYLAWRLGGPVATWVTTGLFLFNAKFLPWMVSDTPEAVVTLFYSLALVSSFFTLNKPNIIPAFLTGLLISACWIFRVETFFFIPAYGIFLIIVLLARKVPSTTIAKVSLAMLVGWIVFAVPMMIYLGQSGGEWLPEIRSDTSYKAFSSTLETRDMFIPPYSENQSINPVTGTYIENIFRAKKYGLWILKWWGVALAILGAFVLIFSREKRIFLGPIGAAVIPIAILAAFGIEERMLIPYMAIAQVVIGVALAWAVSFFLRHRNPYRATGAWLVIAGLVLSGLAFHAKHALIPAVTPGDLPYEHSAMGYYIDEHHPEIGTAGGKSLASHLPWVKYYGNLENFSWLPVVESVDELREIALEKNIGWIVIDSRTVYKYNPPLSHLTDPRNAPAWLEPVVSLPSNRPIVLYEIIFESD